jgi:alkylation response protein AidB-like acyl-CoA dehydrogenase
MRFVLSDDQLALAGAMRALCTGRFALDRLRAAEGGSRTVSAGDWDELGRAGVFSIRTSEENGGLGLGMAESVVVFEELGRGLVPGPLAASALASGIVDGASDGTVMVGSVTRGRPGFGAGRAAPVLVSHLESIGALVVVDDEGLAVVDPRTIDASPAMRSLDPLSPMWVVNGEIPEGERLGGPDAAVGWRYGEGLLSAAMCVGIAAATLEMAVAYARSREQFGRPVGSFQAVKHICADMLVRLEMARVSLQAAAVISDDPEVGDPVRAMAGATLLAVDAALENGRKCIQVHGGMGFTWEVPAHLYLMRARVLEQVCKSGGDLAEAVAGRL